MGNINNDAEFVCEYLTKLFDNMGIELQDSPQVLTEYIYIEFSDHNGNDRKFRIHYPLGVERFFAAPIQEIGMFVLKHIVSRTFA